MSIQTLPSISLTCFNDGEYVVTAEDRTTGAILAAASSYDCETAILRIDLQLIEMGFSLYEPEVY